MGINKNCKINQPDVFGCGLIYKEVCMLKIKNLVIIVLVSIFIAGCGKGIEGPVVPRLNEPEGFSKKLNDAALERLNHKVRYDPAYVTIGYPSGDVSDSTGVCSDVIVRSYRTIGIDLQKDLHEEITKHFNEYPSKKIWGLNKPDRNIDHRRVPNLEVLFSRKGETLPVTSNPKDYLPGDIVTWRLSGRPHIGIVVNRRKLFRSRYMIVHNIGRGPKLEDKLFQYPVTGHFRYYGALKSNASNPGQQ